MKTAMILAAGRGERLKPLTNVLPKALCLLKGKALIEYHLLKLKAAGFERVLINHAHLGGQIRQQLGNGSAWNLDLQYLPEPPGGLETGGGIYNALPFLGSSPFLVINADVFIDLDLSQFNFPPEAKLGHLLLVKAPALDYSADFGLDQAGWTQEKKQGWASLDKRLYTFSGLAYYHPAFFAKAKPGRYSVRSLLYENILAQRISAEVYEGTWVDIGSPARLAFAENILNIQTQHANISQTV